MSDRFDILKHKQDVCRDCKSGFTEITKEPCFSCKWLNKNDKVPSNFKRFDV